MQIFFICHPGQLFNMYQVSVKGNFGVFLVDDEKRQKLVSVHPQILLWQKNWWRSGIVLFVKYSEPCHQHRDRRTTIIKVCNKKFTLFHIIMKSIFSQISKLNFDYRRCIVIYVSLPHLSNIQNVCTDRRYWWGRNIFF